MADKLGPKEKIYEAYSALADGRVKPEEDKASVSSSDGKKTYTIRWKDNVYVSDDNATYWQGYPGYPVIAVMMLKGELPYDKKISELFKDVNWHELNNKYKRDYAKAVKEVIDELKLNEDEINKEVEKVYEQLKEADIIIRRKL